ncbi:hypothetical protein ACWF7H_29505 [Peribacillus butanolivorans]|uniref:hypothetical protein n=1 Tax=Peribacillus butanolivorans TaxID=421767 RepID=UPI0036B35950
MRKILIICMSLILFGCQSQENSSNEKAKDPASSTKKHKTLIINEDITRIEVSKSKGVNKIIFEDQESIQIFYDVISKAVREDGIVNMTDPDYYVMILYANNEQQNINVWVGESENKSTLMEADNTHTIYTVEEDFLSKLLEKNSQ